MDTYCLQCGLKIENPRETGGKVIQKYCSNLCRWRWHNGRSRNLAFEVVRDLKALILKYQRSGAAQ